MRPQAVRYLVLRVLVFHQTIKDDGIGIGIANYSSAGRELAMERLTKL